MKQQPHIYPCETIIIGGGLNAKMYAYFNKCPCVYIFDDAPFRFDFLQHSWGVESEEKNMLQIWERLNFVLSLAGQLPVGNKSASFNIRDNILNIATKGSRLVKLQFNKLVVFDDRNVQGLPPIKEKKVGKFRILDWFDVRSGMEHEHDSLESDENFVKKVIFYPSDRFGNQSSGRVRKDLVSVSHLDEAQVRDFEYSDTMARFKVLQMMKDAGIKGARNGRDTNNPELYRYYSPKIEATQREVIPDITNIYEEDPRFEFRYETPEEIIKEFDKEPDSYASKLINLLAKTN